MNVHVELAFNDALHSTFFSTIDNVFFCMYVLYIQQITKEKTSVRGYHCCAQVLLGALRNANSRRKSPFLFLWNKICYTQSGSYGKDSRKIWCLPFSPRIAFNEDTNVKSVDKQKMKGYVLKWQDSKILLGCALLHGLLRPCSILCKVLQEK